MLFTLCSLIVNAPRMFSLFKEKPLKNTYLFNKGALSAYRASDVSVVAPSMLRTSWNISFYGGDH